MTATCPGRVMAKPANDRELNFVYLIWPMRVQPLGGRAIAPVGLFRWCVLAILVARMRGQLSPGIRSMSRIFRSFISPANRRENDPPDHFLIHSEQAAQWLKKQDHFSFLMGRLWAEIFDIAEV